MKPGVPQDLIYLAVAESGFQPQALNRRSGAGGMWQFMPTGAYGLARNGWVDERFDPEKSSRAYAKYIKSLYDQFGDWYLAMAAYNWGPGNVQRAVMRTGYADYWELYRRNVLPSGPRTMFPASSRPGHHGEEPKQYGLEDLVPDPPVVSDTVSVDYSVDLRLVADVTDATLPEIVDAEPEPAAHDHAGRRRLRSASSRGNARPLPQAHSGIPEDKRASWRFHIVRAGESLDSIASGLHSTPAEIATANNLDPDLGSSRGHRACGAIGESKRRPRTLHYVTRAGDTLVTVADRFNVSVEDLRRWNHLRRAPSAASHTQCIGAGASGAGTHVTAEAGAHAQRDSKTKSGRPARVQEASTRRPSCAATRRQALARRWTRVTLPHRLPCMKRVLAIRWRTDAFCC